LPPGARAVSHGGKASGACHRPAAGNAKDPATGQCVSAVLVPGVHSA